MSHQLAPTFTQTQLEDDLARGEIIVSKDGFNVEGGDLEVMLETKNTNTLLNDIGTVLGQTDPTSIIANITAKLRNFVGTFTTNIVAPTLPNSLDVIGMRVFDSGTFVYEAPTILTSDWDVGEQPKMVDRVFGSDPAVLRADNNETKETVFNFGSILTRDLIAKISADINSGTPNLTFDIQISDDNLVFVSVDSGTLTDGVPNLTQTSQTFQFVKVIIIAEDENPFDVDFKIFEVFDRVSSPTAFPSSDFSPTTNINDGDLDTSITKNTVNDGATTIAVGDFGSIASRKPAVRIETVPVTGTATTTFDLEVSDDDIVYVSVKTGTLTDNVPITVGAVAQSFRFIRITLDSTDASIFTVDHRIYQIFAMQSSVVQSPGPYINDSNAIDGDVNTAATHGINANTIQTYSMDIDFASIASRSIGFIAQFGWITMSFLEYDLQISDDDITYVDSLTRDYSGDSGNNVRTDEVSAPVSFRFLRMKVRAGPTTIGITSSSNFEIYCVDTAETVIITSYTGPASEEAAIVDEDLTTFGSEISGVKNNVLVADFGSIAMRDLQMRIESIINSGVIQSEFEIEISDDNISYVSLETTPLTDNIITNPANLAESFRYARLTMRIISGSQPFDIDHLVYEIYGSSESSVLTSDWSPTTNMDDSELDTFETLNVTNPASTRETVFDFITTISRDIHALIRPITINGTPTYSYVLSGSLDNISFFTIDSGALTSGITTDASGTPVVLRFVKIEMIGTEIGTFEADFDIFEIYDANVINALDSSTVLVGGSTAAGGAIDQTDPLTFQIEDAGEGLQPNQPFPLEALKFLTMNVTALRTGQVIQLDRVTTVTIQRG